MEVTHEAVNIQTADRGIGSTSRHFTEGTLEGAATGVMTHGVEVTSMRILNVDRVIHITISHQIRVDFEAAADRPVILIMTDRFSEACLPVHWEAVEEVVTGSIPTGVKAEDRAGERMELQIIMTHTIILLL